MTGKELIKHFKKIDGLNRDIMLEIFEELIPLRVEDIGVYEEDDPKCPIVFIIDEYIRE